MDSKDPKRNYLLKPAAAAGIAATAAAIWRPGAMVEIPGFGDYPFPLLAAGATFIAAEGAALINEYLFPHIPVINAFEAPAHTALNIGALTAVTAGVEGTLSPGLASQLPLTEMVAFAAAAEVGSTYLVDSLIMPMWQQYSGTGQYGQ